MVDRSGRMVTTNTKARPARPRVLCIFNMATAMAARESILTEADIPGASLRGRKPSELKNEELKVWLRCRDDQVKGLKTKAELVRRGEIGLFTVCGNNLIYKCDVKLTSTFFRVEDCIKSVRDKNIVDPDPNQLYTRRKQKKSLDLSSNAPDAPVDNRTQRNISYPTSGWGTSLENMPLFRTNHGHTSCSHSWGADSPV